jgi:hypothetical protein
LPPDTPIAGGGGGGQPADPGGQPQLVLPRQPTVQPHPIAITKLLSQVEGRHVVLNAQWWSGVEPCTLLDRVQVDRDGNTFTITVIEGLNPAEVACIDLAVLKATVIDLGELEPGTYTVRASTGDAEPITVVVE